MAQEMDSRLTPWRSLMRSNMKVKFLKSPVISVTSLRAGAVFIAWVSALAERWKLVEKITFFLAERHVVKFARLVVPLKAIRILCLVRSIIKESATYP